MDGAIRLRVVADIPPGSQGAQSPILSQGLPSRVTQLFASLVDHFLLVDEEPSLIRGIDFAPCAIAAGGLFFDLCGAFEEFLHGVEDEHDAWRRGKGVKLESSLQV